MAGRLSDFGSARERRSACVGWPPRASDGVPGWAWCRLRAAHGLPRPSEHHRARPEARVAKSCAPAPHDALRPALAESALASRTLRIVLYNHPASEQAPLILSCSSGRRIFGTFLPWRRLVGIPHPTAKARVLLRVRGAVGATASSNHGAGYPSPSVGTPAPRASGSTGVRRCRPSSRVVPGCPATELRAQSSRQGGLQNESRRAGGAARHNGHSSPARGRVGGREAVLRRRASGAWTWSVWTSRGRVSPFAGPLGRIRMRPPGSCPR